LIATAKELRVKVIAFSPFGAGFLTGNTKIPHNSKMTFEGMPADPIRIILKTT
jgi:aryl-alcohol dehydrogenase-like predicted oxidoreductase